MAEMERLAAKLPHGIGYDWTGLSYEEKQAGSKAMLLYMLSIAVVFLCLAALYESWAIRGSAPRHPARNLRRRAGYALPRLNNDIYFQVGIAHHDGLSVKTPSSSWVR